MSMARVAVAATLFSVVAGLGLSGVPARGAEIAPANSSQAMGQVINELNVDAVPMSKVVDFLRNVSGSNIVVNWKALEAAGVTRDTPITLNVRDLTLRKMLQLVLSQSSPNAPLSFSLDGNVIQITTQEELDKIMIIKVYIVDDLVMVTNNNVQAPKINLSNIGGGGGTSYGNGSSGGGGSGFGGGNGFGGGSNGYGGGSNGYGNNNGGNSSNGGNGGFFNNSGNNGNGNNNNQPQETSAQKGQELVDLIKAVIRPNIWKDNGGTADIKYFNGKLIVTAPVSVQEAIGGPVGNAGVRFGM